MSDDAKDSIKEKVLRMGMDFETLDKEYDQLQELVHQFDPGHVMILLSTCLIYHSKCRDIDPGTLLGALCDVWNLTREDDEKGVFSLIKKDAAAVLDTDKKLH